MESKIILPIAKRLTETEINTLYEVFNFDKKQFDDLVDIVTNYERALRVVENSFYKWRFDDTKIFAQYFVWGRIKEDDSLSFDKVNYSAFLKMLRKYAKVLPKAENFYDEQRGRKILHITRKNAKAEANK